MLKDETITAPRLFSGEAFTGRTTLELDYDRESTLEFIGCSFDCQAPFVNGAYSLFVPDSRRPLARFEDCVFRGADKAALAQWCWFYNCTFEGCEDGIMAQKEMRLHIDKCQFRELGGFPGAHADGVQCQSGRFMLVRGCHFDLPGANSWGFFESAAGPVSDIRFIGNRGTGGTYHVYLWDDKYGPPTRCFVDRNIWHNHAARLPVAYNFAGGEEMIGQRNSYAVAE
jgi:hypothetical protein